MSGALLALGIFAPLSVLASEMPRPFAWPLSLAACGYGVRCMWKESRRASESIVIASDGSATVDGIAVDGLKVRWRGPLAFLQWRDADGRIQRRSFWPDRLPPSLRRELRLAVTRGQAASHSAGMAH